MVKIVRLARLYTGGIDTNLGIKQIKRQRVQIQAIEQNLDFGEIYLGFINRL